MALWNSIAELNALYETIQAELYARYHTYPAIQVRHSMSSSGQIEQQAYAELARRVGSDVAGRWDMNRDPRYSNGLPRR